jgi:hypothetical protein
MKLLKGLGIGLCLAVLSTLVVPRASADEWNRKTTITFSGPVEVPGVGLHLLPAGTYVFKIVDSQSDRHIVQIFNQDDTPHPNQGFFAGLSVCCLSPGFSCLLT